MNIRYINGGLIGIAVFLVVYHVIQTNAIAAHAWSMKDLENRLAVLHSERNELVAQQATFDDRDHLLELAQHAGMIPAGTVVYLVEDHAVAAR